ncbi:PGN_0703 family putative restriction endonuclease [Geodermatophilus sp. CPCC 205761]|uniref:PGN_0703 family putative restriction endonuclease n=1 Tax=Geodermatophilus sp. CPCC 205761 TaxID=2936597 RepID=UPI003EED53E4
MTTADLVSIASDNAVTRRERHRQSRYRELVLGLPAGQDARRRTLGNYLAPDEWRRNFLSEEAAEYACSRADEVSREGGRLEKNRLFTNMLSSMPLCFSVFGHLRAHPRSAVAVLNDLLGLDLVGLVGIDVRGRRIAGIECEWAPDRRDHLRDGTAFDAVVAGRLADGRSQLIAVETKYVDGFSRDPASEAADEKYDCWCRTFGMADGAFAELGGHATRQLLRNVLLAESVRRGGRAGGGPVFDEAVTVVLARDDDAAARDAVDAVAGQRRRMRTAVRHVGHGELADAASRVDELGTWAAEFRRRYVADC